MAFISKKRLGEAVCQKYFLGQNLARTLGDKAKQKNSLTVIKRLEQFLLQVEFSNMLNSFK